MTNLKWVHIARNHLALSGDDGRILANIFGTGFLGPWRYGKDEYISEADAKRAAEKELGVEVKP